ncbi:hypothetical protein B4U80_10400, partial [Leptotrombidium deliense]
MKERATTSFDTPQQIIANVAGGVCATVACNLPAIDLMKRTIQRTRGRSSDAPNNPQTREELVIPERYMKTLNGEDFLFYDSGPGQDRIIVFATTKSVDLLSRSDHWYADGTFKTSPLLFQQIYTIHGIQNLEVIPALYALLPYSRLLSALTDKVP